MVYRYDVRLDPRFRKMMTLLGVVGVVLVGSVFLAASRGAVGPALFLSLVGAYGAYRFRRMLKAHTSSYLETLDEHLTVQTPGGDKVQIPWSDLKVYGRARYPDASSYLYGYAESQDQFFALPDSVSCLDDLLVELSAHGTRHDVDLQAKELLSDGLRRALTDGATVPVENVRSSEPGK